MTRYLAVVGFLILPAFGQVSSESGSRDGDERPARRQFGPIRDRVDHADGTAASSNWSGYAVTGSNFTTARGSWVVPAATCSSGYQYSAFWVGIDGFGTTTVEQTGTSSDCSGKTPVYYAWYEFYPQGAVEIRRVPVKPGDVISASVVYNGTAFTVKIADVTTGTSFSKTSPVAGAQRGSAEWIAEAPSNGFSILPLANFGTALFGRDSTAVKATSSAVDSSTRGPLGNFGTSTRIYMENASGVYKAIPSAVSTDGTSFSVAWAHN